ncbi:response regulator [Paraburkholderia sediminicola]|uniref:response regulator n=1 Tax=Paraburkholderia sediminicola TaxID=458836 RepID=UPI0038BC6D44
MALVLLVEDDANLLRALETLVGDTGYRVCTASDGLKVMGTVCKGRPDVVVFDVMMPGMDGVKFVRALKAVPALADIPVVMTSAAATAPEVAIHTFLAKPFSAATLLQVLRDVQPP